MDINEAMRICFKNNVKIYPQITRSIYRVAIDRNGKVQIGQKTFNNKNINDAIIKTYLYIAQELNSKI